MWVRGRRKLWYGGVRSRAHLHEAVFWVNLGIWVIVIIQLWCQLSTCYDLSIQVAFWKEPKKRVSIIKNSSNHLLQYILRKFNQNSQNLCSGQQWTIYMANCTKEYILLLCTLSSNEFGVLFDVSECLKSDAFGVTFCNANPYDMVPLLICVTQLAALTCSGSSCFWSILFFCH